MDFSPVHAARTASGRNEECRTKNEKRNQPPKRPDSQSSQKTQATGGNQPDAATTRSSERVNPIAYSSQTTPQQRSNPQEYEVHANPPSTKVAVKSHKSSCNTTASSAIAVTLGEAVEACRDGWSALSVDRLLCLRRVAVRKQNGHGHSCRAGPQLMNTIDVNVIVIPRNNFVRGVCVEFRTYFRKKIARCGDEVRAN